MYYIFYWFIYLLSVSPPLGSPSPPGGYPWKSPTNQQTSNSNRTLNFAQLAALGPSLAHLWASTNTGHASLRGLSPIHQGPTPALGFPQTPMQTAQAPAYSPSGQQPLHEVGPSSQMGQGSAPPMSTPIVVNPATREWPMQPTKCSLLEHIALVTIGECDAGNHRTFPT